MFNDRPLMVFRWLKRFFWKKSRRATDAELSVIRRLLPWNDWRAPKLFAQVEHPPHVERHLLDRNRYELVVPYVLDSRNLVPLDADVTSSTIDVALQGSGKTARFCLVLARGGFLHKLRGEMTDGGDWPLRWSVDRDAMQETSVVAWMPGQPLEEERARIIDRLAQWLQVPSAEIMKYPDDQLWVRGPCLEDEIPKCESRESVPLPQAYKEFVRITDGLEIMGARPYFIAGLKDVWLYEQDGERSWVISDLAECGIVVARPSDGDCYYLAPDEMKKSVGSLRQYVLNTLKMLDGPQNPTREP